MAKRTKNRYLLVLLLCCFGLGSGAQNAPATKSVFWGERLVDQQTTGALPAKVFKVEILHRFGTVENGMEDLLGVYAPSNISMGLAYGINKRLMVEFQTEKDYKMQELGIKYSLLQQTVQNEMPVSLSYFFSVGATALSDETFGDDYQFTDRLVYTNQLLCSKQIHYKYNLMLGLSYVHFNKVQPSIQHDKMEANLSAGYKLNPKQSVFVSYQHPWDVNLFNSNENATLKPVDAMAIGYESATYSHNFQVFLTTRSNIIAANDMAYNQNTIALQNVRIGFNIRVYIGKRKLDKKKGLKHD